LRCAANTVDGDPSINLALGELFLEEHAFTQAESSLGKAYADITSSTNTGSKYNLQGEPEGKIIQSRIDTRVRSRISYLYGLTQYQLGHIEIALTILADGFQVYSSYPGVAYAYGRLLLENNEPHRATIPLAVSVSLGPDEPGPYLDYGFTLLTLKDQPDIAIDNLHQALTIIEASENTDSARSHDVPLKIHQVHLSHFSNHSDWDYGFSTQKFTSHILDIPVANRARAIGLTFLAEAYEANGQFDSAIRYYSLALETTFPLEENWKTRLSLGMGRVALALNQPEIAIAALQEATRNDVNNV
jgi:tetratricopeptide (TPR) repeat protein